jgi:hypothetical protein
LTPKPTQAFYGKGYTVYYGFTQVEYRLDSHFVYAFGYPSDHYRQMITTPLDDTNLTRYAIVVTNPNRTAQAADATAHPHKAAVTSVVPSAAAKKSKADTSSAPAASNAAAPATTTGTTPALRAVPSPRE